MERDNDLEKKKEDIQEMIRITEPFTKLNTQICNKKIIILLGRTRAGKSTLANYLLDYELTSVKEKIENTFKLEITGIGPQIGKGSVSTTTIPTVSTLPNGSILIDSPGFEDNRGISQDIFNAIYMNHIRFANSVKFVLVCYIGDLVNDNVQSFTTLLKKVADLVVNVEMIYESICIIFTKDEKNSTSDQLREVMEIKILKEENLAVDKRLLSTFLENSDLIGIFKSPQQEGIIDVKELDVNVKEAIDACNYVNVNNLEIQSPLADQSKIFLREILEREYYTEFTYFESEIERTIECIINYLKVDEYVFASYGTELHVVKHELLKPLAIKLKLLLENVINNMEELKVALETLLEVRKLKLSTKFKSHFEFILLLDNALLLEKYYKKLVIKNFNVCSSKLLDKVQHLINKIDIEYHRRKDENVLMLYEENNFENGFSTFNIGYKLAKAKIINSVQTATCNRTSTVETPDTEPLMPRAPAQVVAPGHDIAKVADVVIVDAAIAKSTIAKAAFAGVAATGAVAGATAGVEVAADGEGDTTRVTASVATVGINAVSAVAIGAVAAGAAAAGAATSLTVIAGASASGAAFVGAAALGTFACVAGLFAAGVAISSVHCTIQYSLINRSEIRRKQNRDINNEEYILSATTL